MCVLDDNMVQVQGHPMCWESKSTSRASCNAARMQQDAPCTKHTCLLCVVASYSLLEDATVAGLLHCILKPPALLGQQQRCAICAWLLLRPCC